MNALIQTPSLPFTVRMYRPTDQILPEKQLFTVIDIIRTNKQTSYKLLELPDNELFDAGCFLIYPLNTPN